MKNRDTGDTTNRPVYHAPEGGHYGYVMVNDVWMGINERGLAVMNTQVSALGFGGSGMDNGALNRWIIQHCETVEEVCFQLNYTSGEIGPGKRQGGTCVGVIDRYGEGAFIEISGTGAYARFIVNSYDSQANHPRYYPGYASGPSGRDRYALDIMSAVYTQKGCISWGDVAQNVSRYVRNKEQGSTSFSISGEISNTGTQAAMVAVSGDTRYEGKLNCMWGEYGNPPLVGLFVPSMAYAGQPPTVLSSFWNQVREKRTLAQDTSGYYNPAQVREIQSYTFFAEDYTFSKYDQLLATIPDNLSSSQLKTELQQFIASSVEDATQTYIEEPQITYHTLTHETVPYGIATVSNSTISNYQSSSGSNIEIKFNVSGPTSTTGFTYVTIPSELCNQNITVTIGTTNYSIDYAPEHESNTILKLTYTHPNLVKITSTFTSVSDINQNIVNAPANETYFIQTRNPYDAQGNGYVYSTCQNTQYLRLMDDPQAVTQTPPNTGKPTFTNKSIILFGGPLAHNCTEYYEKTSQAPLVFTKTAYGQDNWGFTEEDGTTIPNAWINMTQWNGHSDIFTVETFIDSGNNFVAIMYGITQYGTLAAGPHFRDTILPNIDNYTQGWYIFKWTDGLNSQPYDGFPQIGEITQVAQGN